MREVNDHVKKVVGIPTTTKKTTTPKKVVEKDYTKAFVWIGITLFTIVLWATIYNLIF